MDRNAPTRTQILGAKTSGVTKKIAAAVDRKIKSAFLRDGGIVTVKGTRFIPSTKVALANDEFQVMANTVIEVASAGGTTKLAKSVDSVLTIGRENNAQVLKEFDIPSLAHVKS